MSYQQPIVNVFQHVATNNIRALMFGGGLAYAFSNGFWHHTPLFFLNPVAYNSYQVFINHKQIIDWSKQTLKELKN
jgi:hypothetical protein